jgi:hypothetical protein
MSDEIQAEPPEPRRRRFDDSGETPVQKPSEGIPVWVWLLVGMGGLFCACPLLGAVTWFLLDIGPTQPMPAKPAPAPLERPEQVPAPEKR